MFKDFMNYRKFYFDQTGREIPRDFDIHHIDQDQQNNEIFNLVALPKTLHHRLHFLMPPEDFIPREVTDRVTYDIKQLAAYIVTFLECCEWVKYRNVLLGMTSEPTDKNY